MVACVASMSRDRVWIEILGEMVVTSFNQYGKSRTFWGTRPVERSVTNRILGVSGQT